jgi:NAD+ kinase
MVPGAAAILITPVCPHSLSTRSIVVAADDKIDIHIVQSKKSQDEEATVSVDGEYYTSLSAGGNISVMRSDYSTRFFCFGKESFYNVLRKKL